jgi:hypothetical protein
MRRCALGQWLRMRFGPRVRDGSRARRERSADVLSSIKRWPQWCMLAVSYLDYMPASNRRCELVLLLNDFGVVDCFISSMVVVSNVPGKRVAHPTNFAHLSHLNIQCLHATLLKYY